jgi:hypothetical protein
VKLIIIAGVISLVCVTQVNAFDSGQYQNLDPKIRDWFKSVRSKNGVPCCDIADGHRTTWRGTSEGGYEVPIAGEWRKVPPEAIVLNAGNPTGEAIVWYVRQGENVYLIRCFVPGGGV